MISVTLENLANGMKVVRGQDWKWGNQDRDSEYGIIKVTDNSPYLHDRWVEVGWQRNDGTVGEYAYRVGAESSYDLYVYDDVEYRTLDGKIRNSL